ncbi:MAG: DUF1653 domain-containing protein [Gallionella sp.]|jgi:hypothetical protein
MKYRHYKGGIYEVVCEARLEADPDVVMMVYQSAVDGVIWTRPKEAFLEMVEWEGCMVPRFAAIG